MGCFFVKDCIEATNVLSRPFLLRIVVQTKKGLDRLSGYCQRLVLCTIHLEPETYKIGYG